MSSLAENLLLNHEVIPYLPPTVITANGDSGSNPFLVTRGHTVVFFINVTAVSGTSPTLNVYIDIQDPISGAWAQQDASPQITSPQMLPMAEPVRSTKYRVRWVLGGSSPSFTISVNVVLVK